MRPLSRKSGIFTENLPEEVVLYDKTRDKVHCLNKTAAAVWESSDGSKTVDELLQVVEMKSGVPTDRKLVLQALEELEEAGLMEAGRGMVSEPSLPSRREAVGKIAMAGALVATIVAAAPEAHASTTGPTEPPKLPISHNPPEPPAGHNPPNPQPSPKPPTGHNPTSPQPPTTNPPTGHNPTNPQPPSTNPPTGGKNKH